MEIQSTLIQGLLQSVTEGLQQPRQAPLPQPQEPLLGQQGASPGRAVSPEQAHDSSQAGQTGDSSRVLSSGEKEIIELFFDGQEGVDFVHYGPQPPKPIVLGNFIDVRV